MHKPILTVDVRYEHDVVLARQRARQIAAALGFDLQDQTRISTSTSELARNVYQYARTGKVAFAIDEDHDSSALIITVSDNGPGIKDLDNILRGRYVSRTGMGLGLVGAKRLMDVFKIHSAPGVGTTVTIGKNLPVRPGTPRPDAARISLQLSRQSPQSPYEELQQQNQELLRALEELRKRQEELAHLNRELEDTNRGVVALYAELDERADYLQRANELKTAFLSNMTHEFRTPLNAIQSLTNLLLDRTDGDLTPEQEKQVLYVRRSAEDLSELVNDLLDLAKVEAGKISLRPQQFRIDELFGTLRGMLKPLLAYNTSVNLIFESDEALQPMFTDDRRVSQVLRNLISNALKFTPKGEVRVRAEQLPDDKVLFTVADTGVGIGIADQERIFEEWVQLDHPIQRELKGTGLGLPLSRRLAQLLGGTLTVTSTLGLGSTFSFTVPRTYAGPEEVTESFAEEPQGSGIPVLVLENNPDAQFVYRQFLNNSQYQALTAKSVAEARQVLERFHPRAIVMDIILDGEDSWPFLRELRAGGKTTDLPVIMVSVQENQARALAMGANEFALKPVDRHWLLRRLDALVRASEEPQVLVVDDDDISRYLLRNVLSELTLGIVEVQSGTEALAAVERKHPSVIFLDLVMPGLSGFEVLERLDSPAMRDIAVVVHTSKVLTQAEHALLSRRVLDIIPKNITREDLASRVRAALSKAGVRPEDSQVKRA